jgi:hypothetical protein
MSESPELAGDDPTTFVTSEIGSLVPLHPRQSVAAEALWDPDSCEGSV